MVAKYKQKRLQEEWCLDSSKGLDLEGSEREAAKRECRERLLEADLLSADRLERESEYERQYQLDIECYTRSKADPNYRCTCFDTEQNDTTTDNDVQCSENIPCSQNTEQTPRKLQLRQSFALFLADYKASRNR